VVSAAERTASAAERTDSAAERTVSAAEEAGREVVVVVVEADQVVVVGENQVVVVGEDQVVVVGEDQVAVVGEDQVVAGVGETVDRTENQAAVGVGKKNHVAADLEAKVARVEVAMVEEGVGQMLAEVGAASFV
jgi:hypothetical protein